MGSTSWGDWSNYIWCKAGKRVNGFRLRVEKNQGGDDDSALNGIQLSCENVGISNEIPGIWGTWRDWVYCNDGTYVTSFDLLSQHDINRATNFDNVAASNVKMRCSDGKEINGGGLDLGDWEGYKSCPTRSYLCGVRAQFQKKQGDGDDTALNRIEFQCCIEKGKVNIIVVGFTYHPYTVLKL